MPGRDWTWPPGSPTIFIPSDETGAEKAWVEQMMNEAARSRGGIIMIGE